jgi:hypothetical protein
MADEETELKPPATDAGESGDSTDKEDTSSQPEVEKVELTKEEHEKLLKSQEVAENYRKENELYRKGEAEQRSKALQPVDTTTEFIGVNETTQLLFNKDLQEVIDTDVETFSQKATPEQWNKFKELYPGVNSLLNESVVAGRLPTRARIQQRIKEYINYAQGGVTENTEKARAEAILEVDTARRADIGTLNSSKKPSSVQVLQEDIDYANSIAGGSVTPERAKEIRENREKREKEGWV